MNPSGVRDPQRALADFAASASIPVELRRRMQERLLDTVAVGVLTRATELFVPRLLSVYGVDRGTASVWGQPDLVDWPHAAFVNGCLAHGSDYDDTQGESALHGSSVIVPAALAAAEDVGAQMDDFLEAMAVGLEVAVRLAGAAGHRFNARGFHTTPNFGVFGAAASAGRLRRLSGQQMFDALGLCGSLASGLTQFSLGGGDVKRLHAGWAAQAGCYAALWAQAGLQGPDGIFDGRFGLYETHLCRGVDYEDLTQGLGEEWRCARNLVKRYPCCHHIHAPIDIAIEWSRYPLRNIETVTILLPEGTAVDQVCEPESLRRTPGDAYAAKFSAFFAVAAALLDGRVDLDTFSPCALTRTDVAALVSRTTYRAVPREGSETLLYPGGLELVLSGGMKMTKWLDQPESVTGPALTAKVVDCFRAAGRDGQAFIDLVLTDSAALDAVEVVSAAWRSEPATDGRCADYSAQS
jgi:2-methylcitrate dehydratase PrpD